MLLLPSCQRTLRSGMSSVQSAPSRESKNQGSCSTDTKHFDGVCVYRCPNTLLFEVINVIDNVRKALENPYTTPTRSAPRMALTPEKSRPWRRAEIAARP